MDAAREQIYQRMVNTLEELTKLYRQLLELVRREKELLIGAKLEELNESNTQKDSLIMKVRLADQLRQKVASELARLVGANSEEPRLLEIAQKMGGLEGDRLRSMHSTLDVLLRRTAEINKGNEEHARTALKTLNGAMGELKETLTGKSTYERKGQYKLGPETTGNFVSREA